MEFVHWIQAHWVGIGLAVLAFDNLLFAISPLTPWAWDDTLASRLQEIIKKVFPNAK
jgi:hypothetical protein